MYLKILFKQIFGIILWSVFLTGYGRTEDLAESVCRSYIPVLANAHNFRLQGIPISIAEEMVSSAYDLDVNLYRFLVAAVDYIYENPNEAMVYIKNGTTLSLCIKEVRGF